jgi:hypothetical protein
MCLEYAPHGSLRTTIDDAIVHREPFNKYRDKDKIITLNLELKVIDDLLPT